MSKGGAPHGIRHGKAVHSFEFIENIRNRFDATPRSQRRNLILAISEEHKIPKDTIKDWVYLRTRVMG